MPTPDLGCARCTTPNHPSVRFCAQCGLPLGSVAPDAQAGREALGPDDDHDPVDSDIGREVRDLAALAGFQCSPAGHGWRMVVPVRLDRKQAVYLGPAGVDPEARRLFALVSVCGPANDRDARILLKHNARAVDGHFAIKVLRGEEYFVVTRNVPIDDRAARNDIPGLVRRIAEVADALEDKLSRGLDLY